MRLFGMARPSPQTDRVVALIELLAERPNETISLAEATRRLAINKSTCLSMLQALTVAGWLLRDPYRKTYRLGPALLSIGQAAATGFSALEFAPPAMVELSRWAAAQCVAFAVERDHVSVLDQVRDVRAIAPPIGHGHIPLRPPFGAVIAAFGDAAEWLDLAPPGTRSWYEQAVAVVRSRGFAVELITNDVDVPETLRLPDLIEHLAQSLPPQVLAIELDPRQSYVVSAINAPVIDARGQPVLILTLMGFPGPLRGNEIVTAGERLTAATATVSRALRGAGTRHIPANPSEPPGC